MVFITMSPGYTYRGLNYKGLDLELNDKGQIIIDGRVFIDPSEAREWGFETYEAYAIMIIYRLNHLYGTEPIESFEKAKRAAAKLEGSFVPYDVKKSSPSKLARNLRITQEFADYIIRVHLTEN